MGHQDDPGVVGDGVPETLHDLFVGFGRGRDLDVLDVDAFPAHPLAEGGEHPAVVLGGGEDLVAGLQIHPQQQDLHRLGGIPDERDFFGVAPEDRREPLPHVLLPGLQDLPHRVHGGLFLLPGVADERFGDHPG